MGFVSGEYTVNSTEADENTPLNSSSRRHRLREPFSCHHLLLFSFLLLLLAEVVVLQLCGIFVLPSLSYDESENSTFPECFPDSFLGAAISLSVIETVNCCIFVIIMKKIPFSLHMHSSKRSALSAKILDSDIILCTLCDWCFTRDQRV